MRQSFIVQMSSNVCFWVMGQAHSISCLQSTQGNRERNSILKFLLPLIEGRKKSLWDSCRRISELFSANHRSLSAAGIYVDVRASPRPLQWSLPTGRPTWYRGCAFESGSTLAAGSLFLFDRLNSVLIKQSNFWGELSDKMCAFIVIFKYFWYLFFPLPLFVDYWLECCWANICLNSVAPQPCFYPWNDNMQMSHRCLLSQIVFKTLDLIVSLSFQFWGS